MKTIQASMTIFLLILCMLSGCQMGLSPVAEHPPVSEFRKIDPASLRPGSRLAIVAFEMAKRGMLDSYPNVKFSLQEDPIENQTTHRTFSPYNIMVMDFRQEPKGKYSQNMVVESVDQLGRIDLCGGQIAYQIRRPNQTEAAEYEALTIKHFKAIQAMDKEFQKEIKQAIAKYQGTDAPTIPDPIDMATAVKLSHEIPVFDLIELSSQIIYPAQPRHRFYVLPFEIVAKDPNAFNHGFESLAAVEKHAIPLDKFMGMAKPKQKFVLFVFFFDRVDPRNAIQIGFSDTAKRRSEPLGQKRYADSGEWPVLVELFSIDEEITSDSSLYVNLFKVNGSKSRFFKKTECIGCCRLK